MKEKLLDLLRRSFAEPMARYPFSLAGSTEEGHLTKYCYTYGFMAHSPKQGTYVFRSDQEGALAYEVTYVNKEFRKIKVRPTRLHVRHNESFREHRKRFPHASADVPATRISLINGGPYVF